MFELAELLAAEDGLFHLLTYLMIAFQSMGSAVHILKFLHRRSVPPASLMTYKTRKEVEDSM